MVPQGRFFEGLNAADGEGRLYGGLENIPHPFALLGLHIAVSHKGLDGPAHRIPGTAIGQDQAVFGREQLLEFVF